MEKNKLEWLSKGAFAISFMYTCNLMVNNTTSWGSVRKMRIYNAKNIFFPYFKGFNQQ